MSQNSEREFLFTWRIKNFSMCPLEEDEGLKSPIFAVDMWKKRKLQLHLYPKGWENSKWISCYASTAEDKEELDNSTIGYTFKIAGSETDTREYTLDEDEEWGVQKLVQRNQFLKKIKVSLPNDTLTIQYRMWIINEETNTTKFTPTVLFLGNENVFATEMLGLSARHELEEFQRYFCSTQCSAETVIRVGRKSLVCPFKRVQTLGSEHRMSLPVTSALVDDPSFVMTFYLTGESDDRSAHLEIRREESDYDKHVFVKCEITVLSSLKDFKLCIEGEHFFKSKIEDDVWNFPFSNHRSEFQKLLDTTNDVLYLRCEFAYSRQGDEYHKANVDAVPFRFVSCPSMDPSTTLGNDFKDIYKTGILSDVMLRVGKRCFKAHKTILATRSPVFCAMFTSDMKEKGTGFVDITDLDPDTLDRMLVFLYSDQLDDLGPEDAVNLYSGADKYQVLSLRRRCSLFLQSILSVSNVCLILNLADLHQDDNLLEVAQAFVHRNSNEVFASDEWKILMENNVKLSANVMHQMLTWKTN